jgi:lipoprotein NlpD
VRHWGLLLLVSLLAVACAGSTRAPVENRHGEVRTRPAKPESHMVVKGDTLYSIAWRYGIDYRTLAGINGIAAPFTIYPGQQLRLRGAPPVASSRVAAPPKPAPPPGVKPGAQAQGPVVTKPSSAPVTTIAPGDANARVEQWAWPASGKVVRTFSGTVHKGIDIDGKAGDPVKATAAGKVVYAGSGIVGYGKLLIVKHNETYLSAYGHNRRLLVKEGADVRAGELIAEKGSSATNSVKLHFEIRREGKPVDPLQLLPGR